MDTLTNLSDAVIEKPDSKAEPKEFKSLAEAVTAYQDLEKASQDLLNEALRGNKALADEGEKLTAKIEELETAATASAAEIVDLKAANETAESAADLKAAKIAAESFSEPVDDIDLEANTESAFETYSKLGGIEKSKFYQEHKDEIIASARAADTQAANAA